MAKCGGTLFFGFSIKYLYTISKKCCLNMLDCIPVYVASLGYFSAFQSPNDQVDRTCDVCICSVYTPHNHVSSNGVATG